MTDKQFTELEDSVRKQGEKTPDDVYYLWMAEKGKRDLFFLNTVILGYDKCVRHVHGEWDSIIHQSADRVLLMAPRKHFKTMYVTVGFAIQNLINDRNIRMLLVSATLDESKGFLRAIKDHLELNPLFRQLYGDYTDLSSKWTESSIIVSRDKRGLKEPTIQAMGVLGNIVGDHYELGIVDDPVNIDDAESHTTRERKKRWFQKLPPILERMIFIGTPWHYDDLYADIRQRNEQREESGNTGYWKIFRKPAIKDDGTPYFPEQFTIKVLDRMKDEMREDYYSQYLLEPIPKGLGDFNSDWLREYNEADLPEKLTVYQVIDLASSTSKRADWFVILTAGVSDKNDIYIKSIFRKRLQFPQQTREIKGKYYMYKPSKMYIDAEAYQKVMTQYLKADDYGKLLPLKEVPREKGDKTDRIAGIAPILEKGAVYVPRGAKWVQDFKEELDRFPKGHDDQLDCLYMLITQLRHSKKRFSMAFVTQSDMEKAINEGRTKELKQEGVNVSNGATGFYLRNN